jgi:hypothetical protein
LAARLEERRDEVLVAPRQLRLDEGARDLELRFASGDEIRLVLAAVDDLHVVDREDRQPMRLAVEIRPRLEVGDDHLRLELGDEIEVRGDVLREARRARDHVRPERLVDAHPVLLVDHVEAVDAVDPREMLFQEIGGAARRHDLDLVVLRYEMLEHDARAHRMSHSFAHDAVENLHG